VIELRCGGYSMIVDPDCGGSLRALRWKHRQILREQVRPGVLASASFPLVPFCNRIRRSRFTFAGRTIWLAPNHPEEAREPAMHGFGWTMPWKLQSQGPASVSLALDFPAGDWPWPFYAEQHLSLCPDGVMLRMELTNRADDPMPAGLGFHPFFPRDRNTFYRGLHLAEFGPGGRLTGSATPIDWWQGNPVNTRLVDTTYAGSEGPLSISWPERGLAVEITSSEGLSCTHVYVPASEEFFCVEPVSHLPGVVPSAESTWPMKVLKPGEVWAEWVRLQAYDLPAT
jgi:aldose 1-epimerase